MGETDVKTRIPIDSDRIADLCRRNGIRKLAVFGSVLRDDFREDSDIDVLVLLESPIRLGQDIDTCVEAIYPLMLRIGRTIDTYPVDIHKYEEGRVAFYREAKKEGIPA